MQANLERSLHSPSSFLTQSLPSQNGSAEVEAMVVSSPEAKEANTPTKTKGKAWQSTILFHQNLCLVQVLQLCELVQACLVFGGSPWRPLTVGKAMEWSPFCCLLCTKGLKQR